MKFQLVGLSTAILLLLGTPFVSRAAGADRVDASCVISEEHVVTVSGRLRLLRTVTHPFVWPDGSTDYSVVDAVDEYELSSPDWNCGDAPLLVRYRYGHVKAVSCADNVQARVSGLYRRDMDDGPAYLSAMTPSDIRCAAPLAP